MLPPLIDKAVLGGLQTVKDKYRNNYNYNYAVLKTRTKEMDDMEMRSEGMWHGDEL